MYLPHWSSHSLVSGKRASIQDRSLSIGSRRLTVFADHDGRIGEESVRRNDQIGRCRHAPIDPASEIELRLMARTEKTAEPIRAQVPRRDFRAKRRNAAQMGADADRHEDLRLDRAVLVLGVRRLVIYL